MIRVAVLGGSGYIGSHIVAEAQALGVAITTIAPPRVEGLAPGPVPAAAKKWRLHHGEGFTRLCRALEPFDVVINAAGAASPRSSDLDSLFSANAVLAAVAAQAAAAGGVRRFIHVSTAAVQGRLEPLDESCRFLPLSPYATTKSQGEEYLLDPDQHLEPGIPPEVTVYRPTSVHGVGHEATRTFARLVARVPAVPLAGAGDWPVPVALVGNVAAGIMFAATVPEPRAIVLQPWEGITARLLVELFGVRRVVPLPPALPNFALSRLASVAAGRPQIEARLRWFEILLRGQAVQADALVGAGYRTPVGLEGWRALVREVNGGGGG